MSRARTQINRFARTAVWGLAFLAMSGGLILFGRDLARRFDGVGVRIAGEPVSGRQLQKLEAGDGEIRLASAWTRSEKTEAVNNRLGTSATLRPVAVCGEIGRVCPMKLLSGSFPTADDTKGCLLTADAAMELVHSLEAEGAKIDLSGKTYVVRGVIKAFEPMIVLRNETALYENLEFTLQELSNGGAAVRALLYRYSLSGDLIELESGLYAKIFYGLCFLPPALFLVWIGLWLFGRARISEKRSRLLYTGGAAAAMLAAALLLWSRFYWPQSYLPTKCSDFGFWRTLIEGFRVEYRAMLLASPIPKDVLFFGDLRQGMLMLAAALLVSGGFAKSLTRK